MAFLVGSDKSYYLGTGSAAMIEKDYERDKISRVGHYPTSNQRYLTNEKTC